MLARQLFAALFYLNQASIQAGGHRAGGKLDSGHRSNFQHALLLAICSLKVFFYHLPDALRHTHLQIPQRDRQPPMGICFRDQPLLLEGSQQH